MISESLSRKNRSLAVLQRLQIPFVESLPEIEDTSAAALRTVEQIMVRARCFLAVLLTVNIDDSARAQSVVNRYRLSSVLSGGEKCILQPHAMTDRQKANLSWESESLVALLWAMRGIDQLPPPSAAMDPYAILSIWDEMGDAQLGADSIRSLGEILDERDFYFRLHWAVRDAWVNEQPVPADLIPGVVSERHRAFNWLTSEEWDDWDEVTTDT